MNRVNRLYLGRPFMRTAGSMIDMKNGVITMEVGDHKISINMYETMRHPYEDYSLLDVSLEIVSEVMRERTVNANGRVRSGKRLLRARDSFSSRLMERMMIWISSGGQSSYRTGKVDRRRRHACEGAEKLKSYWMTAVV